VLELDPEITSDEQILEQVKNLLMSASDPDPGDASTPAADPLPAVAAALKAHPKRRKLSKQALAHCASKGISQTEFSRRMSSAVRRVVTRRRAAR
jgi:hypothetical protein